MSSELYLVAHKVRGEPAFDVAERMECPKCLGAAGPTHTFTCTECDSEGYWWIIPTSGHRAYPYWDFPLNDLIDPVYHAYDGIMPEGLRDHYTTKREAAVDLIRVLGLIHRPLAPAAPLKRRF